MNNLISYFPGGISEIHPADDIAFDDYLEKIKEGEWKDQVLSYREKPTKDEKKKLPYVTISGTFFPARQDKFLDTHSGIVAIDIDARGSNESIIAKYDTEIVDPNVYAQHRSAGGRGLVVYIKVPPKKHEESFKQIKDYFFKRLGLVVDNLPAVSHPRYVSYDPGLLVNEDSPVWGFSPSDKHGLRAVKNLSPFDIVLTGEDWQKVDTIVHEWFEVQYEWGVGSRNIHLAKLAGVLAAPEIGVSQEIAMQYCIDRYEDDDFKAEEIRRVFNSIYAKERKKSFGYDVGDIDLDDFTFDYLEDTIEEELPDVQYLLQDLITSGEITILFGDTNTGKSILAVQLGEAWTAGRAEVLGIPNEMPPQKVLLFDFELSNRQFQHRYKDTEETYENGVLKSIVKKAKFNKRFMRACPPPTLTLPQKKDLIMKLVDKSQADVVIIDNMSALLVNDVDKDSASDMMTYLRGLKDEGKTVIVVGHTPKRRKDRGSVDFLDIDSLSGNKQLANLADSVIGIGKSRFDGNVRYIKQLKCRSNEIVYDEDKIIECEIHKDEAFLKFDYLQMGKEYDHVELNKKRKEQLQEAVIDLHLANKEWGYKKLYKELSAMGYATSHTTIARIIRAHKSSSNEQD